MKHPDHSDIILECHIEKMEAVLAWCRNGLTGLPPQLRPTMYSAGEVPKKHEQYDIYDFSMVESFLSHHGGCFLHGRNVKINISLFAGIPSVVDFWAPITNRSFVRAVDVAIECLGEVGAVYGFACDFRELECRNQTRIYLGNAAKPSTSWYGRDFSRYVPGFYWLNYFSNGYLEQMKLDIHGVADALSAETLQFPHGHILKLYDDPTEWIEHQVRVGRVIREWAGVFCIEDLNAPERMDVLEEHNWSMEASAKWP